MTYQKYLCKQKPDRHPYIYLYKERAMHLEIINMNVFGGTRSRGGKGPRGPRGFPGKDSSISDFCTWLPNTISEMEKNMILNLFMEENFPPESTKNYLQ